MTLIILTTLTTLAVLAIAPRRAAGRGYSAKNVFFGMEQDFEAAFGRADRATE